MCVYSVWRWNGVSNRKIAGSLRSVDGSDGGGVEDRSIYVILVLVI